MSWGYITANLIEQGHRLLVVRPRQSKADRERVEENYLELLVTGIPIPQYKELKIGLPTRRKMAKAFKEFKPDLVHIATEGFLGWSALRLAKRWGIPVTSSFHTNFHQYGKHYGLQIFQKLGIRYLRAFHNRTLATFAPTKEMCLQLEAEGFLNLRLLSRGIDQDRFNPARRDQILRQSWQAGANDPVVLYVGRLAAEKNIPLAIQAFEAFQKECPQARFVCVGDGPLRNQLEKKHPDFVFAGMRKGDDLGRHYASGDVFFAPSTTETFGNVVTEGMASGLAVLTFDYAAGRQHIRNKENGFTVPYNNNEAFVECASYMGAHKSTWEKVRPNARQTASQLSWSELVKNFVSDLSSYRKSQTNLILNPSVEI